ncbi:50S ribosomal protein L32 [Marinitenerispora sediminis]|uniref:Large ribosomal subunit protein bL32 n=1 Tax=Marinitenerispora sediminis TaxID=1931232 RepID=A0A368T325_9ACTN|nr:50S ribosomal protein L32 [Marinitenerispora sediminis]RCV47979.1 50S ribosomal protein L32 [Marinitenerispora sediminis]RCV48856.1 50S ribosomal protein L32 [Marinitenerispora sediminis]RCV51214.1 50S ribosomal protein L32 [Marinitenerispora sediminis]
MAVPKRRMSRSNTRRRRSQWRAAVPQLVPLEIDGRRVLVPARLVPAYRRGLLRPAD